MTISILGVMVLEILANGREGEPLPAQAKLVKLTLTEERMKGDRPRLWPAPGMQAWADFEEAAQKAFAWWSKDRNRLVDVEWKLEPHELSDSSQKDRPKETYLPPLKGPSLGGAFAAGLLLLYYRGGKMPTPPGDRFADAVEHIDLSRFAISATVATMADRPEDIKLGPVGGLGPKAKVGVRLVVSDRQPDGPQDCIRALTVKDALNQVFDLQARLVLES